MRTTASHPDPRADPTSPAEVGVLMLKPGVVFDEPARHELAARLRGAGYEIAELRVIESEEVRERHLLRRHYHDHFEVARVGRLLPEEQRRLVEVHDNDDFRARFGDPASLPAVPATVLAEQRGIELATIGAWASRTAAERGIDTGHPLGSNEVGELADVQLLVDGDLLAADHDEWHEASPDVGHDDGPLHDEPTRDDPWPPVFVLNPQIASLASWWEDGPDATVVARLRPAGASPRAWSEMRSAFLGTGPPGRWPVGSVRRDMLDGRSALRYRPGIAMGAARNGVHLSNGPIEALRELAVWFDLAPGQTVIGRALVDADLDIAAILDAVYIEDTTGVHALSHRTAHLGLGELVAVLRHARLLGADEI